MRNRIFQLIMLAAMLLCFCTVAGAVSDDDEIGWLDAEEYTLYWGDEINHSGYNIMASDFSTARAFDTETDYVVLTIKSIYGDEWAVRLANNTVFPNNTVFDDRLNITATEIITGNDIPVPYTTISVALSNLTNSTPVKVSWINGTFDFHENNARDIYMDERAHMILKIQNQGSDSFDNITVTRELPRDVILDPDLDPHWNFSLDSYGIKTLDITVKALKPGTYELPGVLIRVERNGRIYSRKMNDSVLEVHGPDITLNKTFPDERVDLGGNVDVTLDIVNKGDRAAYIDVSDQLPAGSTFVSGDMTLSRVLMAGDSVSLSYSMTMGKAGDIIIPSAQVDFVDSNEYEGTIYSKKQLISVQDPDAVVDDYEEDDYSSDYSYEDDYDDYSSDNSAIADTADDAEDHGSLQLLYDVLDLITGFLMDTKDKIL